MSIDLLPELGKALWETCYMVVSSALLACCLGGVLGLVLFITRNQYLLNNRLINRSLSLLINVLRSLPFIILLILLIPVTRLLVGTSIGTTAAIVPLTISALPFFARLVETALAEVDSGLIETGLAMGASVLQILLRLLLPEALPSIVRAITVTTISLIGYSAMAGAIGGGGLGDMAIRYGYQRFDVYAILCTCVLLIALVQSVQWLGEQLEKKLRH